MRCRASARVASPTGPTWSPSPRTRSMVPRALARCGCATGAEPAPLHPRRRAGAGPALGHAVAGAVRRLRRGGQAGRRALRRAIMTMSQRLWAAAIDALGPGWTINGSIEQRYRGNLNIRRDGLDAARLIADLRDIAFSLGIGLRQRLGPAKPCAPRARARRPRGALVDPPRLRPLYERGELVEPAAGSMRRRGRRSISSRDNGAVSQGGRDARQGSRGGSRDSGCSTSPGRRASRSRAPARA